MKKIFYTVLFITVVLTFNTVHAQYCGSGSGQMVCVAAGTLSNYGFESPDSIPCVVQGVPYNQSIQLKMFNVFYAAGSNQNIDSVEFNVSGGGIGNLPCGLCWATNKATNRFTPGEYGCINISGTTSDDTGQYQLQLNLKAWINHDPAPQTANYLVVNASGIKMWLRVQSPNGSCIPVDTSASAKNDTASATCTAGIGELNSSIFSLSIIPNPVNSNAVLKFNSVQDALYTLRITDMTGKVISTKEIAVKPGENSSVIERNGLSAGVYFLSLSDGKNTIAKRFAVID